MTLFAMPIRALVHFSLTHEDASYILLIPILSAWILFTERQNIFQCVFYDLTGAATLIAPGAALLAWTLHSSVQWSASITLSAFTLSLLLFWISGLVLFFGRSVLKRGHFAFLFLLLVVPFPDFLLNRVIYFMQWGSAEFTALLFDLFGVPALREGFVFHLPSINIEVARECSGIRSSIALLILAVLIGHFLLHPFWKQLVFVLCGVFVMIVKNAVRIVTLTLLANYVDPEFLYGNLHREGGVVFFLLGLLLLVPVLWLLQRGEKPQRNTVEIPAAQI